MTDNLFLTFPKDKCEEVEIHGRKFIQADVGMSAKQFILKMLEYLDSGDESCAIVRKEEEK